MQRSDAESRRETEEDLRRHRVVLQEAVVRMQAAYDRTVMTLAGGALGVSFAFVNDFVEKGKMQGVALLCGAWLAWVISLACVLYSFAVSAKAHRREVTALDSEIVSLQNHRPKQATNITKNKKYRGSLTTWLNFGSGFCFAAGAALMIAFVFMNLSLQNRSEMSTPTSEQIKKGDIPPPPPPPR